MKYQKGQILILTNLDEEIIKNHFDKTFQHNSNFFEKYEKYRIDDYKSFTLYEKSDISVIRIIKIKDNTPEVFYGSDLIKMFKSIKEYRKMKLNRIKKSL